jgi:hypothetical protein
VSRSKHKVAVTFEELLATLRKTAVPTVVVEGSDDVIVLRRLEDLYADRFLTVLPAGGRATVLKIYESRHTLPAHVKILFVADQDTWVLTGIPAVYTDAVIFFSDGYSLENDVYRDGEFFNLMDSAEKAKFREEIVRFIQWYSNCVCRFINGEQVRIKTHPDHILDSTEQEELKYDEQMREVGARLNADPDKLLRGKALIGILMRQLGRKGRLATHHSRSLFDRVGAFPGPLIRRLFDEIGKATA